MFDFEADADGRCHKRGPVLSRLGRPLESSFRPSRRWWVLMGQVSLSPVDRALSFGMRAPPVDGSTHCFSLPELRTFDL